MSQVIAMAWCDARDYFRFVCLNRLRKKERKKGNALGSVGRGRAAAPPLNTGAMAGRRACVDWRPHITLPTIVPSANRCCPEKLPRSGEKDAVDARRKEMSPDDWLDEDSGPRNI